MATRRAPSPSLSPRSAEAALPLYTISAELYRQALAVAVVEAATAPAQEKGRQSGFASGVLYRRALPRAPLGIR